MNEKETPLFLEAVSKTLSEYPCFKVRICHDPLTPLAEIHRYQFPGNLQDTDWGVEKLAQFTALTIHFLAVDFAVARFISSPSGEVIKRGEWAPVVEYGVPRKFTKDKTGLVEVPLYVGKDSGFLEPNPEAELAPYTLVQFPPVLIYLTSPKVEENLVEFGFTSVS